MGDWTGTIAVGKTLDLGAARTSSGSDKLPPRVPTTSEESSPDAAESGKDGSKKKPLKRPAASKKGSKRKGRHEDDDEDESPDADHQPIAGGLDHDDDEGDGSELSGLSDLLRMQGEDAKPTKKPAANRSGGATKRPSKKVGLSYFATYTGIRSVYKDKLNPQKCFDNYIYLQKPCAFTGG